MVRFNLFALLHRHKPRNRLIGVEGALSGYFEIRGDRLVGWASDGIGGALDDMRIEVRRHGKLIAVCEMTPEPAQKRAYFTLPIEGRFTAIDLVTEDVIVTARDGRGNSGRVNLDGATQLELVRDHFGRPAETVLDLDFCKGGNAGPHLGPGWYHAEANFTWTRDEESIVHLPRPEAPGTYALRLTAAPLLKKPETPRRTLELSLNGEALGRLEFTNAHSQFNEVKFPHALFGAEKQATLRLYHPEPLRPCDIGESKDNRRLAFNVRRLSIARLLSAE